MMRTTHNTIKTVKTIGKVINTILLVMSIIICLWFAVSYLEIILKNLSESPSYSDINLIKMLLDNSIHAK